MVERLVGHSDLLSSVLGFSALERGESSVPRPAAGVLVASPSTVRCQQAGVAVRGWAFQCSHWLQWGNSRDVEKEILQGSTIMGMKTSQFCITF